MLVRFTQLMLTPPPLAPVDSFLGFPQPASGTVHNLNV